MTSSPASWALPTNARRNSPGPQNASSQAEAQWKNVASLGREASFSAASFLRPTGVPAHSAQGGRLGDLIKCLWSDGQALCLFSKRLERGRFLWPSTADGTVTISTAQLGYLGRHRLENARRKPGVRRRSADNSGLQTGANMIPFGGDEPVRFAPLRSCRGACADTLALSGVSLPFTELP
jgi:hypothetical protein